MARPSSTLCEVWVLPLVVALVLFLAASTHAQNNLDVCRLTTDTWSVSGGYGTGIYDLGKFAIDDIDEVTRKSFRYERETQIYIIDVEVEYGDMRDVEKGKPTRMMLSLHARRAEDQNSKTILPVEAETRYRHKWGTIAVSTHVVQGDTAQHFQLTCSDGLSNKGVQRGEPAWLKKAKKKETH